MPKRKKQVTPMVVRLTEEMDKRFEKCAERTKQSKHGLARDAIEAAVEAIEQNDYRIVVPIQFEVTHIPVPAGKTEAPASKGGRPDAAAGGRSSGSTARSPHGLNEGAADPAPRLVDSPSPYLAGSKTRSRA